MGVDHVHLVADFLRLVAVPAAAIEFLDSQRREAIESWLAGTLPKVVKGTALALALVYVMVLLLVSLGPWLVLSFLFFGKLINLVVMKTIGGDSAQLGCAAVAFVLSVVTVIAAVLEKWVIPESWVLSLAYPYETFSVWANGHWLVDWLLPDFTAAGFLAHYREVVEAAEDWLWDWLAFVYGLYFFVARGIMLVMIGAIQLALFASIALAAVLVPLTPLHFVMKLSEYLKRRLRFAIPGRLPVIGLLVVMIAELTDFALDIIKVAT